MEDAEIQEINKEIVPVLELLTNLEINRRRIEHGITTTEFQSPINDYKNSKALLESANLALKFMEGNHNHPAQHYYSRVLSKPVITY